MGQSRGELPLFLLINRGRETREGEKNRKTGERENETTRRFWELKETEKRNERGRFERGDRAE
jgi:hypothetical protein